MSKNDTFVYPAVFTYEEGREIAVVFPDFDVATSGIDDRDALISAKELLGITIIGKEEDHEMLPTPTPLQNISLANNERAMLIDVYISTGSDLSPIPRPSLRGEVAAHRADGEGC